MASRKLNIEERKKFISKDVEKRKKQLANLRKSKGKIPKVKDYSSDIIQFCEQQIKLPEQNKLITLEDWEKDVFHDCFYENRPRLILISIAKKNGKSTFSALVNVFYLLHQEPGELYLCANSKDQTSFITFRKIVSMIRKNPLLDKQVKIYTDVIENRKNNSILRVLSSSYRSSAGLNPLLITIDELGSFDTDTLRFFYDELQLGPLYKNPLILVTSTAGRNEEGILWDLFQASKKGNTEEAYYYIKQGKEANPSSFLTDKYLNSQKNKPGMRENLYKRLHQNQWAGDEDSFITDVEYRNCIDLRLTRRPKVRIPIYIGLDVGYRNDYTAIVSVTKAEESIHLIDHKSFIPKKGDIDFSDIEKYLLGLDRDYIIRAIFFDPFQAINLAQNLQKKNIRMIELPQTQQRTIEFSQMLYDFIRNQKIGFYDNKEIRDSLINCKVQYSTRGYRLVKRVKTKKIDLAISLAMALYGANKYLLPIDDDDDQIIHYSGVPGGIWVEDKRKPAPSFNFLHRITEAEEKAEDDSIGNLF
jgi:phage terminase large subunit-like protein